MDIALEKAIERIASVTQNEAAMREYTRRQMAIWDRNSELDYVTTEKAKKIARKLKARNMTIEDIIEITDLTEKQISEL